MKLITKEMEKLIPKLGDQELVKDPIAFVKLFNPLGPGYWFIMEYDPETQIAFGYVSIFGDWNDKLGDFSVDGLEQIRLPLGMSIERDLHFKPTRLSEIKKEYTRA
jgi:hypothetical protein